MPDHSVAGWGGQARLPLQMNGLGGPRPAEDGGAAADEYEQRRQRRLTGSKTNTSPTKLCERGFQLLLAPDQSRRFGRWRWRWFRKLRGDLSECFFGGGGDRRFTLGSTFSSRFVFLGDLGLEGADGGDERVEDADGFDVFRRGCYGLRNTLSGEEIAGGVQRKYNTDFGPATGNVKRASVAGCCHHAVHENPARFIGATGQGFAVGIDRLVMGERAFDGDDGGFEFGFSVHK